HLRHQKSAVGQRQEVVGDVRECAARREHESRTPWLREIEEEDAVLTAQQSEQAAARQDVLVRREMAMVWLISGAARSRTGDGPDDLPIAWRVLVEVDDRQKVGRHPGLVP